MSKAIVLLSGGQDSTTCLYWAKQHFDEVEAISADYGQRHKAELNAAEQIARAAGVMLTPVNLQGLGTLVGSQSASALVSSALSNTADIRGSGGFQDKGAGDAGLPTSFVPGRNILFLAMAAAQAVVRDAKDIITGVCQTDFSGYPDCRREFVDAMEKALTLGMPSGSGPIRIVTPLMWLTKAETVKLAKRLPGCWDALKLTLTCYHGKRPGCGTCPACELRAQGFRAAGEVDPAQQ